ncbi:hypothetical protein H6G76_14935 [Nostoc sp. FACHB-152]|uniref:hypothetical protein n=1 Tax=unclassified Nostoc TaxID=2593658 RepID=UPI0016862162|nr:MULTISPECIES: hypothetical protein [unclassified Nostoc]MBD2448430.1 hypothetical protein [Nostoc sp. FACHB-152]MBD2470870.1 hypothetical protein [Nostoc sp. FACHB-145]
MKFKTVCASIAVTTSIATSMIFFPQDYAQAQHRPTQTKQVNSKTSTSLEIKWVLGFIPLPMWIRNSNSLSRSNNSKLITTTKQGYKHKEVPVPVLIPGLVAFGAGLIRKHRQDKKQVDM